MKAQKHWFVLLLIELSSFYPLKKKKTFVDKQIFESNFFQREKQEKVKINLIKIIA